MKKFFLFLAAGFFLLLTIYSLSSKLNNKSVIVGAQRTLQYIPFLQEKKVAIVANHTSLIGNVHLVDSLISAGITIEKIFSPEHGFRGDVDAGEYFTDYIDSITGLQVISLYGKNFKPKAKDLEGIEIMLFDIQDVGVRFYTYISTMHYILEACAENNIDLIILDRPNPNGFYIDGPVMQNNQMSFVGLHPIPVVYGMTIGELAMMINGEKWLKNNLTCKLKVITCENYTHNTYYDLPVNPSPNLQNMAAIYLYPSLGLFEGTIASVGRGTDFPFRVIGFPGYSDTTFKFTPKSIEGVSKYPMYKDSLCFGINLQNFSANELREKNQIDLNWIIKIYNNYQDSSFFNNYFEMLAGNITLRNQIINGTSVEEIRKSWQPELNTFKQKRQNYLLYPDF